MKTLALCLALLLSATVLAQAVAPKGEPAPVLSGQTWADAACAGATCLHFSWSYDAATNSLQPTFNADQLDENPTALDRPDLKQGALTRLKIAVLNEAKVQGNHMLPLFRANVSPDAKLDFSKW